MKGEWDIVKYTSCTLERIPHLTWRSHEQGRFHNCYRDHVARARAIWGICKRGSHLSAWWRWHAIGRFRLLPKTKWKPLKSCKQMSHFRVLSKRMGFPGGSDGKESACIAGHMCLILVLGISPGAGHGNQFILGTKAWLHWGLYWMSIIHQVLSTEADHSSNVFSPVWGLEMI